MLYFSLIFLMKSSFATLLIAAFYFISSVCTFIVNLENPCIVLVEDTGALLTLANGEGLLLMSGTSRIAFAVCPETALGKPRFDPMTEGGALTLLAESSLLVSFLLNANVGSREPYLLSTASVLIDPFLPLNFAAYEPSIFFLTRYEFNLYFTLLS